MMHVDAFRLSWFNRSYEFMTLFWGNHAARQNILPRMFCLGKRCQRQVLPGQKMPPQGLPRQPSAKGNLQPTLYNHIGVQKRLIDT